jgi:site-specific DNA recombinase
LVESLARDDAAEARELVRSLVESITLHPDGDGQRIEIRGELAAILALSSGAKDRAAAGGADALALQVKLVAGIGFEPMTFRL